MTDHANDPFAITIEKALTHDDCPGEKRCQKCSAAKALRRLLAGHAAEVEQLRQEHSALTRELATMLGPITPHHGLSHAALWIEKVGRVLIERDEARADAETLRRKIREMHRVEPACGDDCWICWFQKAALAAAQEPPAEGGSR